MTWLARGTLLRVLAPLTAGVALAVALQAAEAATRLYALLSPSLLAGLAGLAGTGVLAAVALTRRRAAIARAAAADAAMQRAAAQATQDRLRFLMRLDHELKNPLTASRAGLANLHPHPLPGDPADEIGQVWQELARGRAARSLPGTGIGLALVRVIAARHEGRVAIRSREGQGTVVSIRLPAPDRARTAPAVAGLRQHRDTP